MSDHNFKLETVQRIQKAMFTLGLATHVPIDAFSANLEVELGRLCAAIENMREPKVLAKNGMQLFRIRHKKTGLFKKAGSRGWSKEGKAWTKAAHIKAHLNLLKHYGNGYRYPVEVDDWEVLEYRPDQIIVRTVREFHHD